MKHRVIFLFFFLSFFEINAQKKASFNLVLKKYYPQIADIKDNKVFFKDGSSMIFDDKKNKIFQELLDNPDIEDQFRFSYLSGSFSKNPTNNQDPGRIRNEAFFKKIYGETKAEVEAKLVEIIWCPKLVNQKIKVTSVNDIDKIVTKMSDELDQHPEYQDFVSNIAGTFTWRNIAGSTRISMHSFGMTMDINLDNTNYWQWDCKCKNENAVLKYKNKIPAGLVKIFEKYGFIWGGKWYHYDTMHFEYRPELIFKN
jgi:D-alanyl-D-alanine carboxypeptidase